MDNNLIIGNYLALYTNIINYTISCISSIFSLVIRIIMLLFVTEDLQKAQFRGVRSFLTINHGSNKTEISKLK